MRQVGNRKENILQANANTAALVAGVEFSMAIAQLAGGSTFVPKGLYRFRTHDEAARNDAYWLAAGMAQIARKRQHG